MPGSLGGGADIVISTLTPSITAVQNSASGPVNAVSPDSFIAIYTSNIGTMSGGNLFPATSFQGIQVLVNGAPAPLYSVDVTSSFSLINPVAPSSLPSTGTATINIQNSSGLSPNFALRLAPDDVGVFRIPDATHPNNAAAQIANTNWTILPSSTAAFYNFPACTSSSSASTSCAIHAKPGDSIVVYFTGGGLATPKGSPSGSPVATGSVAPVDGSVIYQTVQTPTLTIDGLPAAVQFSGVAPGTAAEYQINTVIPAAVRPGDSVPVVITFPNSSDTVTIAVQAP